MVLETAIWLLAGAGYAVFWYWYVGFGHKIRAAEIDTFLARLEACAWPRELFPVIRRFMETDTGREIVMVNNLQLKRAVEGEHKPLELLEKYQKPFLAAVLRRGGHPLFVGRAVAASLEHWGLAADYRNWGAAGLIRYRSRRDMLECVLLPQFQDNHHFKQQALEKTFAYPTEVMMVATSPRWTVALLVLAVAALTQLALC